MPEEEKIEEHIPQSTLEGLKSKALTEGEFKKEDTTDAIYHLAKGEETESFWKTETTIKQADKLKNALKNAEISGVDESTDFNQKLGNLLGFTSAFTANHHAQLAAGYSDDPEEQKNLRQQSEHDTELFKDVITGIIGKAADGEALTDEEKATLEIATKSGPYSDEAIEAEYKKSHGKEPTDEELTRYANTLRMNEFMSITSSEQSPFDNRFNQVDPDFLENLSEEEKEKFRKENKLVEKDVIDPQTGETKKKLFTVYKPPTFPDDDERPKFNHKDPPPYLKTGALAALAGLVNAFETFDKQLEKAQSSSNPGSAFAMAFLFLFAGLTVNMALAIANGTKNDTIGDVPGVVPLKKQELLDSLKSWTDFQNDQRAFHKELLKPGTLEEVELAEPAQKNKALSSVIDKTNDAVRTTKERKAKQAAAEAKPVVQEDLEKFNKAQKKHVQGGKETTSVQQGTGEVPAFGAGVRT